jgi:Cu+-exporting ATPase
MNNKLNDVVIENKTSGCCCASKESQSKLLGSSANENNDLPSQKLIVEGASCGGCVGKIEKALLAVSGVETAKMELSTGIATVSGTAEIQHLIRALESAGFQIKAGQ